MIRIGILGYGNLGKGVELAVRQNDDMELAAVYTRRNPETVSIATPGVADARQYTIPVPEALEAVRSGSNPELTTREKHTRECWVVLEEGADPAEVTKQIVEMPNYFDEYDVTVNFISQEELDRDHAGLPHGGMVIRTGKTAGDKNCKIEYSLDLESNPEFTACVLACYARAVARLSAEGNHGCKTVFDIAPAYLSAKSGEELRAHML